MTAGFSVPGLAARALGPPDVPALQDLVARCRDFFALQDGRAPEHGVEDEEGAHRYGRTGRSCSASFSGLMAGKRQAPRSHT